MKSIIFTLLIICVSSFQSLRSYGQEISIVAGMRSNDADTTTGAISVDGNVGFQGGGIVRYNLSESFRFRSGLLYVLRSYDFQSGSTVVSEPRLSYFDVPVSVEFEVNPTVAIFGGLNGAVNIAKSCGTGGCSGINTLALLAQVGLGFEVMPRFSFELYYERGLTDLADEIEDASSVVGQIGFLF